LDSKDGSSILVSGDGDAQPRVAPLHQKADGSVKIPLDGNNLEVLVKKSEIFPNRDQI